MSETYVIRRRKANGKGWEWLADWWWDDDRVGSGCRWGTFMEKYVFSDGEPSADRVACDVDGQVCRMVPTVRWFVKGTDGKLGFGSSHQAHRYLNKWRHLTKGPVTKRTTYRPEPVK